MEKDVRAGIFKVTMIASLWGLAGCQGTTVSYFDATDAKQVRTIEISYLVRGRKEPVRERVPVLNRIASARSRLRNVVRVSVRTLDATGDEVAGAVETAAPHLFIKSMSVTTAWNRMFGQNRNVYGATTVKPVPKGQSRRKSGRIRIKQVSLGGFEFDDETEELRDRQFNVVRVEYIIHHVTGQFGPGDSGYRALTPTCDEASPPNCSDFLRGVVLHNVRKIETLAYTEASPASNPVVGGCTIPEEQPSTFISRARFVSANEDGDLITRDECTPLTIE